MQVVERRRGRERDADAAREAILNAGQEIFAAHGFSGARVDDIARVSGYNKALIFHYFGDKIGLYRALMTRTKECIFSQIMERIERFATEENDPPPDTARMATFMADCIRCVFDYYVAHPHMPHILAWEAAEGWQTFVSCAPQSSNERWTTQVMELLKRAQRAGSLRADLDPQLLLTTVMSLPLMHLTSLPRYRMLFPASDFTSPEALAHAREQILSMVLRGTLAHPEEATHATGL